MKVISYKSQDLSPGILLDRESGAFQIFGVSCPEDAVEFYNPIFNWFDEYITNPLKRTVLDFKMSYYNSVSAKVFLMIMAKLEDLSGAGHDVLIRWFYNEDDDDLEEAGEEFDSIVDLDFELISSKSETDESEDDDYFDSLWDDIM